MAPKLKTLLKTNLLICAALMSACATTTTTETVKAPEPVAKTEMAQELMPGTLLLNVNGFKVQDGQVLATLFNSEASYKDDKPVRGQSVGVEGDIVTIKFEGLSAGEYGLKIFHDIDFNGTLNVNGFGIPSEPYAFSNNAKGMMGPAKWSAVKFMVSESGAIHTITF